MRVRLAGATYRYAGVARPSLEGIELELGAGEVAGVVGANEAGKSTLCLVASGLAPATIGGRLEGSVTLGGAETRSLRPHELAQRCGILFQNATTQLSGTTGTVYEEVAFGPRNLGLAVAEVVERVDRSLETLGIVDLGSRDPLRLSGGQSQLVALATLLALRPPVLALDEPTSQLDPLGTHLVEASLDRMSREADTALLVVEHKTDLLARLARRLVVIEAGRVAAAGDASLFADPALPGFGIEPPGSIRLARRLAAAGLALDAALLDAALLDALGFAGPAGAVAGPAAEALRERPLPAVAGTGRLSIGEARAENATLELEEVVFDYPDGTRALDGVDLRVEPGERIAIIGQNGSGKSTLVRHLNGLLRPTRGRFLVDGRDAAERHVANLAHLVALAFQDPDRQIFAGRVGAEIAFGPRNLGLRGAELDRAVAGAATAVGLDALLAAHPYDLGYSRRKLLSLASVLAMQAPIIVLDEPTTGQDARGVALVERIVAELSAAGRTVIAISHDMRFAAENFARIVVMRAGRIVRDGRPDEVFAEAAWPDLAATYLEPPLAARVGARLGLGPTPSEAALVEALAARGPTSGEPASAT